MGLVVLMALLLPSKMSDWTGPGVHGAISTGRIRWRLCENPLTARCRTR